MSGFAMLLLMMSSLSVHCFHYASPGGKVAVPRSAVNLQFNYGGGQNREYSDEDRQGADEYLYGDLDEEPASNAAPSWSFGFGANDDYQYAEDEYNQPNQYEQPNWYEQPPQKQAGGMELPAFKELFPNFKNPFVYGFLYNASTKDEDKEDKAEAPKEAPAFPNPFAGFKNPFDNLFDNRPDEEYYEEDYYVEYEEEPPSNPFGGFRSPFDNRQ